MVSVTFLNLAQNEVDDIFEAYNYKEENLGFYFIHALKNTLKLIVDNDKAWTKSSNNTQRCLIQGFPYGVVYQKINDVIIVVAIANLLKKPIHWVSKNNTSSRISHLPETIYIR